MTDDETERATAHSTSSRLWAAVAARAWFDTRGEVSRATGELLFPWPDDEEDVFATLIASTLHSQPEDRSEPEGNPPPYPPPT